LKTPDFCPSVAAPSLSSRELGLGRRKDIEEKITQVAAMLLKGVLRREKVKREVKPAWEEKG
jgi:hypothetical protein